MTQDHILKIQDNMEHFRGKRHHQGCDLRHPSVAKWRIDGGTNLEMGTPIQRLVLMKNNAGLDWGHGSWEEEGTYLRDG